GMRRLMRQLERESPADQGQRIDINGLVNDAVAACAANGKVRPAFSGHYPLWVHAQPDRLASVVSHVIANAQEATKLGDAIEVSVSERDGRGLIEIRDSGAGMSEEFMRRRLVKPFDTTKGSSGMGTGGHSAPPVTPPP